MFEVVIHILGRFVGLNCVFIDKCVTVGLEWKSICERVYLLLSVAGWPVGILAFKCSEPSLPHCQSTQRTLYLSGGDKHL